MKLPESETTYVDRNMSLKDCELMCSRNCSCTAYANSNISNGGSGCVFWTGELFDMRQYPKGGQDLYVRLAASDIGMFITLSLVSTTSFCFTIIILLKIL
jgi:hypothetical protein